MHAFFRFFWPISLISSRWACEFEPQVLAWVGCSKPSCFTRFWAGSGCGGLAGERAWGALGASPGALGGLWALWGPLGGGVWELLGALGASGGLWVARRVLQTRPQKGGSGGFLGAFGGLWGPLGAAGGLWGPLGARPLPAGTKRDKKHCCPFLFFCVFCKGALSFCLALFWRPPQFPKGVLGAPLGSFVRGQGRPEGATVPS